MRPANAYEVLTISFPQTKSPMQRSYQVLQVEKLSIALFSLIYVYIMIHDLPVQNCILILRQNTASSFWGWTIIRDYSSCLLLMWRCYCWDPSSCSL